jgi:hypothetical protein
MDERGGPTSLPLSFFNGLTTRGVLRAHLTCSVTTIFMIVNYYFDSYIDFQLEIYYNIS